MRAAKAMCQRESSDYVFTESDRKEAYAAAFAGLTGRSYQDPFIALLGKGVCVSELVIEIDKAFQDLTRKRMNGLNLLSTFNYAIAQRYALMYAWIQHFVATRGLEDVQDLHLRQSDRDGLQRLSDAIVQINDSAVEIASLQRNGRKTTQSAEHIATATTELTASIQEILRATVVARDHAAEASQAAHAVQESMTGAVRGMELAGQRSNTALTDIDRLTEAFEGITGVVSLIETVAEQTNLLALNATIEAARAGEVGKGFAVVASEVKQLSNQTRRATEQIADRISGMKALMQEVCVAIRETSATVADSQAQIHAASGRVEDICGRSEEMLRHTAEISSVVEQQSLACEAIAQDAEEASQLAKAAEGKQNDMLAKLHTGNTRFVELARAHFKAEDPVSLCAMAKIDHVMFRKRAMDNVMGARNWTSSEVPDHHSCRLGKWYDTLQIADVRSLPAFIALEAPHKRVHDCAREALRMREQLGPDAAGEAIDNLYHASVEVIAGLDDLASVIRKREDMKERRRHERHALFSVAQLRVAGTVRTVLVLDESEGGVRIQGVTEAEAGLKSVLVTASGERDVRLAWCREQMCGLAYV